MMPVSDRQRWDQRYQQTAHNAYPAPDPLLLQFAPLPVPHKKVRALDLAGGVGQNSLWLAEQGYSVDLLDISRVALQRARTEMTARNLRNVNLLQVDLDSLILNSHTYEMIAVFRYLKRELFSKIKAAVLCGGRVIYETYNTRYLEQVPEFNSEFLLNVGELQELFADWHIIHHDEVDYRAQLVAIRPD